MKYIYLMTVKITYKMFGEMYLGHNIESGVFFDYNIAKYRGLEIIKNSIKRYRKSYKCTIQEAYDDAIIDFRITKIYNGFNNSIDYSSNVENIKKKDLYDFIMSICGIEYIKLDHTGYPGYKVFENKIYEPICNPKSFEYDKKYHLNEFKIGDKVIPKVPFEYIEGKVYEIFDIINKDKNIKDSDDPLYFKQGYALTDIYNEYCNEYDQLYFDEDLIKISDDNYYNYYKNWEWYNDNNEIIGTYDDYISGKLNKD